MNTVAERNRAVESLSNLRTVVPVFARELASARRQTARLRAENAQLLGELERLRHRRAEAEARRARMDRHAGAGAAAPAVLDSTRSAPAS